MIWKMTNKDLFEALRTFEKEKVGACLCCVENTTEGHLCVCKEGPVFNINKLLWQI